MTMLRNLIRNEDGAVAVETALVSSFIFVPMLLGLWDVAQIGFGQSQSQEALQAAVTYVAAGNSSNSAGITAAAQSAYGSSISVSTSTVCYCVSTTTSSTPSSISCTSTCTTGNDFEQFMNITVSKTVAVPFPVPYLGSSVTVTSTGQVRTG